MNTVFTNSELIALGVMVLISYFARWRLLLALSAIGIWLYSYSISSVNIPFSIVVFLFGLFTLVYAFSKA